MTLLAVLWLAEIGSLVVHHRAVLRGNIRAENSNDLFLIPNDEAKALTTVIAVATVANAFGGAVTVGHGTGSSAWPVVNLVAAIGTTVLYLAAVYGAGLRLGRTKKELGGKP